MIEERTYTLAEAAREALQVQDACNLSGVAHAFSRVLSALRGMDTAERNRHPVSVLFAHKLASLAGIEPLSVGDSEAYLRASMECDRLARAEVTP